MTGYAVTRPRPLSSSNSVSRIVSEEPSALRRTGNASGGVVV